jgi:hypothetical protein
VKTRGLEIDLRAQGKVVEKQAKKITEMQAMIKKMRYEYTKELQHLKCSVGYILNNQV